LGALKLGSPDEEAKPAPKPSARLPRSTPQPAPEKPAFSPLAEGGPLNFPAEMLPGDPRGYVKAGDIAARPTPQPWLDTKTKFVGALREQGIDEKSGGKP
jgi:hypothetical protein